MTAAESPALTGNRPNVPTRSALYWAGHDTLLVAGRNLTVLRRVPQLLVFSTIQPVMLVVTFVYVFGGEIKIPGVKNYVDYLMPGIFGQLVTFGAINTGIGLAEDLGTGLIERFRSLPMARSAMLAGRTLADLCRNMFVVTLMVGMGYWVGFRPHRGPLLLIGAVALLLLFGLAISWLFAIVGLMAPNAETAQAAAFPLLFPLVFASSAFVRVDNMPGWMQAFAHNQPVTAVVNAVRSLTLESATGERLIGATTSSLVLKSIAWSVGILVIAAPIAVRRYRRVA